MTSRAHLSRGGVDVIVEIINGAFIIRYWGATLHGALEDFPFTPSVANSDYDEVINPGVLREHSRGWLGHPTIRGHRNGMDWSSQFVAEKLSNDGNSLQVTLVDSAINLEIEYSLTLDENGILTCEQTLTNKGSEYILDEMWYWLPLPDRVNQSLDFAGRWSNERNPQRRDISIGRWVRDSHEGRSGHTYTIGEKIGRAHV